MNQPTHAWLAVEAYRKILEHSKTPEGKKKKLDGLQRLLGDNLKDVVVASWLPDSLIKDMTFGHIFKNSVYRGDQKQRFTLGKRDLRKHLAGDLKTPKIAFDLVPDNWWDKAYRVKQNGGHLPARVNSLCQTARDMLRMGGKDVVKLTGVKSRGAEPIASDFLFSSRDVAMMLWMTSHYIADAHMPFHSDNRALASGKLHKGVEDLWGKQVPALFDDNRILKVTNKAILDARPPDGSKFPGLDFGTKINPLKNGGDPWKEAVYLCRAGFVTSFALVPPRIAGVDNRTVEVSLKDFLKGDGNVCGEELFWNISRAIMVDAAGSIARFWQDVWVDFTKDKK